MLLSVVITNTDSPQVPAIVDRVVACSPPRHEVEILVVGSDAEGWIKGDPRVRWHPTVATQAGDKRNAGVGAARGEIVLFLDDDCLPEPGWIEHHLSRHEEGHAIVGGSVTFDRRPYLRLADNVSAFHGFLWFLPPGTRPYLSSANLSVDRRVFDDVGGFPSGWQRAEDLEWTLRCRRHGYELFFEPRAVVCHNPRRSTWREVHRHWRIDAPDTLRVRLDHADLLDTPRLAGQRWALRWGAPLVALWATARTYSHPLSWWRFGHCLPVVYWTKLVWCWSAASSLNPRPARNVMTERGTSVRRGGPP
ncbi:MAG: glycosyltransferase [Acidobacteriota bacterium]